MKELIAIQKALKAPKGQKNSFGNYNYRSCEDILEAVKPLCVENNCMLVISDEMVMLGDRFYVKATATIASGESVMAVSAYAREAETKKGMDVAQVTGASSSYARKYALNGLFCIDDTKDADTMDNNTQPTPKQIKLASSLQRSVLKDYTVKFKAIQDGVAIGYISEALENHSMTEIEAAKIINHCKTKLGEAK